MPGFLDYLDPKKNVKLGQEIKEAKARQEAAKNNSVSSNNTPLPKQNTTQPSSGSSSPTLNNTNNTSSNSFNNSGSGSSNQDPLLDPNIITGDDKLIEDQIIKAKQNSNSNSFSLSEGGEAMTLPKEMPRSGPEGLKLSEDGPTMIMPEALMGEENRAAYDKLADMPSPNEIELPIELPKTGTDWDNYKLDLDSKRNHVPIYDPKVNSYGQGDINMESSLNDFALYENGVEISILGDQMDIHFSDGFFENTLTYGVEILESLDPSEIDGMVEFASNAFKDSTLGYDILETYGDLLQNDWHLLDIQGEYSSMVESIGTLAKLVEMGNLMETLADPYVSNDEKAVLVAEYGYEQFGELLLESLPVSNVIARIPILGEAYKSVMLQGGQYVGDNVGAFMDDLVEGLMNKTGLTKVIEEYAANRAQGLSRAESLVCEGGPVCEDILSSPTLVCEEKAEKVCSIL